MTEVVSFNMCSPSNAELIKVLTLRLICNRKSPAACVHHAAQPLL